jgi:hypothetical protein
MSSQNHSVGVCSRPTHADEELIAAPPTQIGQTGLEIGQAGFGQGKPTKDLRTSPGKDPVGAAHAGLL